MGMKRGNLENVGLGALAHAVNPQYHQKVSVASGIGALAHGVLAYADGWTAVSKGLESLSGAAWKLADMAVQADRLKKEREANARREAMNSIGAAQSGASKKELAFANDLVKRAQFIADNTDMFTNTKTPPKEASVPEPEDMHSLEILEMKNGNGGGKKLPQPSFGVDWISQLWEDN